MRIQRLFASLLIVLIADAFSAHAEEGVAPRGVGLELGMLQIDVQNRWGAPKEREEREAKRQELWRYANSEVLFENGKVRSWKGPAVIVLSEVPAPHTTAAPARVRASKPLEDATVSEILNELQGYSSSSPGIDGGAPQNFPRPTPMGMYGGRAEMNAGVE